MIEGRQEETLVALIAPRIRAAALWLSLGGAAFFLANFWFGIGSIIVFGLAAIIWLAIFVDDLVKARERSERLPIRLLTVLPIILALVGAVLLLGPLLYWSNVAPSWLLYHRNHERFQANVEGHGLPISGVLNVSRQNGRTAFMTTNGMLGAWRGIIHDPAGKIAEAQGWGGGPVPSEVRYIFNSNLVWCQQLDGPWFHCHFD